MLNSNYILEKNKKTIDFLKKESIILIQVKESQSQYKNGSDENENVRYDRRIYKRII